MKRIRYGQEDSNGIKKSRDVLKGKDNKELRVLLHENTFTFTIIDARNYDILHEYRGGTKNRLVFFRKIRKALGDLGVKFQKEKRAKRGPKETKS